MAKTGGAPGQVDKVMRFYDRNTSRFRRLGEGGASIHRAVWGPGVTTQDQAFHHVDNAILALLADRTGPRVVDLGCGVGGSLMYQAASRPDIVGEGLTISSVQADIAATLLADAGLSARVRVRQGDYLAPPPDLVGADCAFSIEAFVHSPDPAAYFRAAADLLRPGGLLLVCDDFLTSAGAAASPTRARRLDEFREAWRVGSLVTVDEATRHGADAGFVFVSDDNLTPDLRLRRSRDRSIHLFVAATRPLPRRLRGEYWSSLAGGDALQHCLATGLVAYRLLTFRREGEP